MNIRVAKETEADQLLASDDFVGEWSRLIEKCPWATSFQSPGFVRAWYRVYRAGFSPVLVILRDDAGELHGLLSLAAARETGQLVAAGAWQAEYQTWIATEQTGEAFGRNAIRAVQNVFPDATLTLKYIPSGTPMQWANHSDSSHTAVQSHHRPLLKFGDGGDIRRSLKKHANKKRISQMGRTGNGEGIELQCITEPAELDRVFDEIIAYHDSRHLALRDCEPFVKDPLKRSFHLELMKAPGLLHVSVLRAGGRIASVQMGLCGRREVQFCLLSHNPWLSRFSPGKCHVYLLAQELMNRGYEQLDLTAGGEAYKDRFANAWEQVHTLRVSPSEVARRISLVGDGVMDAARRALSRIGMTTDDARQLVRRAVNFRARTLWRGLRDLIVDRSPPYASIHRFPPHDGMVAAPLIRFNQNALTDLLKIDERDTGGLRCQFMAAAMRRIEAGLQVFTFVENDRLAHVCWWGTSAAAGGIAELLPGFHLPERAAIVLDCLTLPHARHRGVATQAMRFMRQIAMESEGAIERVFVAAPLESIAAGRLMDGLGLVRLYDMPVSRSLWHSKWALATEVDRPSECRPHKKGVTDTVVTGHPDQRRLPFIGLKNSRSRKPVVHPGGMKRSGDFSDHSGRTETASKMSAVWAGKTKEESYV